MATNAAATSSADASPDAVDVKCTRVSVAMSLTPSSISSSSCVPEKDATVAFQRTSIFGCSRTRVAIALDARNASRRWTTVTFADVRASTRASSMAVSPPPITATSRSR